jgi:Zn-dependent peptidase ImmA (M78 family)
MLPIIAIKKQSKGAMAFTLMHELAHLLLHKTSMLDNQADFYSYQGRVFQWCYFIFSA